MSPQHYDKCVTHFRLVASAGDLSLLIFQHHAVLFFSPPVVVLACIHRHNHTKHEQTSLTQFYAATSVYYQEYIVITKHLFNRRILHKKQHSVPLFLHHLFILLSSQVCLNSAFINLDSKMYLLYKTMIYTWSEIYSMSHKVTWELYTYHEKTYNLGLLPRSWSGLRSLLYIWNMHTYYGAYIHSLVNCVHKLHTWDWSSLARDLFFASASFDSLLVIWSATSSSLSSSSLLSIDSCCDHRTYKHQTVV